MKPVIESILDKIIDPTHSLPFEPEEIAQTVREAFRAEIHDAVVVALREMVAGDGTDMDHAMEQIPHHAHNGKHNHEKHGHDKHSQHEKHEGKHHHEEKQGGHGKHH